jgi:hypothetical protein
MTVFFEITMSLDGFIAGPDVARMAAVPSC